jgi:hypothetical protein
MGYHIASCQTSFVEFVASSTFIPLDGVPAPDFSSSGFAVHS